MVPLPFSIEREREASSARAVSVTVMTKREIKANACGQRDESEEERANSEAAANGLDRRHRDGLWRSALRGNRRRIDLRQHATRAGRLCSGSSRRSAAYGDGGRTAAHHARTAQGSG